jgi:hypothetical protein
MITREFYYGNNQPAKKCLKDRKRGVLNSKSQISPGLIYLHEDVLFIAPPELANGNV